MPISRRRSAPCRPHQALQNEAEVHLRFGEFFWRAVLSHGRHGGLQRITGLLQRGRAIFRNGLKGCRLAGANAGGEKNVRRGQISSARS